MILQASAKTNKSESESSTVAAMNKPPLSTSANPRSTTTTATTTKPPRSMNTAQHHAFGGGSSSEASVIHGMTACPCCNRRLDQGRQTLGETIAPPVYDSLFQGDSYSEDEEESTGGVDMDEQDSMMPGILSDGDTYHVKKVLVQGWVYKKGTGLDWIGSRAWKARWACLVLARIAGYSADVPLLMLSWHSAAPAASTVILLDSTVVFSEDVMADNKINWNSYRFKIKYIRESGDSKTVQVTRAFSCPQKERDSWVYAINQALLDYEKAKAKKVSNSTAPLSPRSNGIAQMLNSDPIPSILLSRSPPTSPPISPMSSSVKRPLPRPSVEGTLLGEALLAGKFDLRNDS